MCESVIVKTCQHVNQLVSRCGVESVSIRCAKKITCDITVKDHVVYVRIWRIIRTLKITQHTLNIM